MKPKTSKNINKLVVHTILKEMEKNDTRKLKGKAKETPKPASSSSINTPRPTIVNKNAIHYSK